MRTGLLIGAAALLLGIGSTVALAGSPGYAGPMPAQPAPCAPPALAGTVVEVAASDMGAMMGPGMMGPHMMGPGMGPGMMRLTVNPGSVPAGQVSLLVINDGALVHEVIVMPLAPGLAPGRRPVGADWRVDETGSLGEAANTCGAGDGDGIAPATIGWTTLTVNPGRYELLCNIAGHYSSGMYAELDVTPVR